GSSGRAYQSVGFGATSDAVYLPAASVNLPAGSIPAGGGTGDLKLTEAFGFRGAYNHNWDPYWSSSLFGSWSAVRYNGSSTDITTAKGQYCNAYYLSSSTSAAVIAANRLTSTCNPNFDVSQLGVVTRWT